MLLRGAAFGAVAGLLLIMVFVFREALPLFTSTSPPGGQPRALLRDGRCGSRSATFPSTGSLPLLVGTLKVMFVAMMFAVPLGVLAAVFASEFAPRADARDAQAGDRAPRRHSVGGARVLRAHRARDVGAARVRRRAPERAHRRARAGARHLPAVFTVSEDALRAVPRSYREASLALGAIALADRVARDAPGRAAGVAAGVAARPRTRRRRDDDRADGIGQRRALSASPLDSVRTLTATIAEELGEVVVGSAALLGPLLARRDAVRHHVRDQRVRRAVRRPPAPPAGGRMSAAPAVRRRTRLGTLGAARRCRRPSVHAALRASRRC